MKYFFIIFFKRKRVSNDIYLKNTNDILKLILFLIKEKLS